MRVIDRMIEEEVVGDEDEYDDFLLDEEDEDELEDDFALDDEDEFDGE